jgi:pre-mRNA-splicing factor ATP-dependent RNA helicase DHX15/PRP43
MNKDLPVWSVKDHICSTVAQNTFTVLQGETGSGKTTQVPWYLAEHFNVQALKKQVACTQPRRVAATSVARRVSQEIGQKVGEAVGYSIRFEDCTSPSTALKFLTDGMLLREAMIDPLLSRYSVIVIDEAHERTLATDILMGMLKELVAKGKRPDLHILVMSATLDAAKFQNYLEGCPLIAVPGRTFPVEIVYCTQPQSDYLDAAVRTCISICNTEQKPGDILVFLTGEEEIEEACRSLERQLKNAWILPLYSALSSAAQQRVFEVAPVGKRKIVIATNIAETSLTIDGVVWVVDCGWVKQKIYNPRVRVESLQVIPISRASAAQRAGRAGRTAPGKCYRLYTEHSYWKELSQESHPEILRCNLAMAVLQLLRVGIQDLVHFDFMDPPAPETLMRAYEQLNYLGAIDDDGMLTPHGRAMSDLPLDPQLAQVLLWAASPSTSPSPSTTSTTAKEHGRGACGGCAQEALTIVSMLSVQPPWIVRAGGKGSAGAGAKREAEAAHAAFAHPDGDHLALLNLYNAWSQQPEGEREGWCYNNWINARALKAASNVRSQLERQLKKLGLCTRSRIGPPGSKGYWDCIKRALVSGFFMQVARLERGSLYATVKDNQIVKIHPSAMLRGGARPSWVLYNEFVLTSQHWVRGVTVVNPMWLVQMAPQYYDMETFPNCEGKRELQRLIEQCAREAVKGNGRSEERGEERGKKHRLE